jgi:hypothetical protein
VLVNTSVGVSEYTVTSLPSNGTYYWRVIAKNASGYSAWTAWWSFKLAVP